MSRRLTLILAVLLLCLSSVLLYIFFETTNYNSKIFPGIYVADFYVGELSKEQAEIKLRAAVRDYIKGPVTLITKNKKWLFYPAEFIEFNFKESIDRAFVSGRNKFFLHNYITMLQYKKNPIHLPLVAEFKENVQEGTFKEIEESVYAEPKDAFFKINGDLVDIVSDVKGQELDVDNLKKDIIEALWKKNKVVNIPVKQIQARKTREDLLKMNIKVKVTEFSTKFNKALKERTQNIRLSAEKINGLIIAPDEVFSFNDAVGERTGEKGYKAAPIFFRNETVPGIGGGVCQLSSTIYNLALITDMEIIERSNHSLPVSYVPLGRDATVNYNHIDLKFKNNTGGYIMIYTEVMDDTLTVKFYGSKKNEQNVKFVSEVVRKIPPPLIIKKDNNMEKGKTRIKEGNPGYQVRLWKIYGVNGREEKKLISEDTYKPVPSILYVGEKDENAGSFNPGPSNETGRNEIMENITNE
ncbi:MAG: hypothetical protein PWQ68_485 [Thermoanaerobacteraceae bacterium]|nr:hypothetical protein [Thermoanaerobacteraceae bacterium]